MELNSLLSNVLLSCKPVSLQAYNSFLILFETGIRHAELNRESIIYLPDDTFSIISKKNGEIRFVSRVSLSLECFDLMLSFSNTDILISRTTLSDYFNKFSFPYRINKGSKQICLHSFRYNYIKKLVLSGKTIPEIQLIIGHKDIKNTQIYIDAILTIGSVLPTN